LTNPPKNPTTSSMRTKNLPKATTNVPMATTITPSTTIRMPGISPHRNKACRQVVCVTQSELKRVAGLKGRPLLLLRGAEIFYTSRHPRVSGGPA